jgi:hypothetical protein
MSRSRRQWGEDSTVRIDLSAGASVLLQFKGNLFDLTADERRLVSDLSLTVQRYRDAGSLRETVPDGHFAEVAERRET